MWAALRTVMIASGLLAVATSPVINSPGLRGDDSKAAADADATGKARSTAPAVAPKGPVTFTRDIAPLVFKNCAGCHHPGEVAPFSLLTYEAVKKRGQLIETVTRERQMPPWKAPKDHGPFVGERRLTEEEIQLIARWVSSGMPEGNTEDLPPVPKFSEGWKLGTPEIVITMPEEYEVPAEGADIYRNFVLPVTIPSGKYIRAVEYRPGNRAAVHHAVFAADVSGKSRKDDEADPAPGFKGSLNVPGRMLPGSLSAWVPGRDPLPLPEGFSFPWPAGADLILQLHLHPTGKPETERSTVALHLTDEAPRRTMVDLTLIDMKIDIPPGERNYRTRAEYTLPATMDVFGIFPHMHLIGRQLRVTAYPPTGAPQPLLWIDDWDFNWQSYYQFVRPVRLECGTKIVMEGVHDNSAENIRNPYQPPQRVTWGEQTTNEMAAAFVQLIPVDEAGYAQLTDAQRRGLKPGITPAKVAAAMAPRAEDLMKKYDLNANGRLSVEEMVKASGQTAEAIQRQVTKFDVDKDGDLNVTELQKALRALVQ